MFRSVITGTGSYIPDNIQSNADFANHSFYTDNDQPLTAPPAEIVEKFRQITGIEERRYISDDLNTSDIASIAARRALEDSGIDPETLDQVIVAHNFGNVISQTIQTDAVPSLANRVKHELGIRNPNCIAYDILFGCPGWIQAMIQADAFFKAGMAKKCLLIGAETLSRVIDIYDRDSMIFSDGAGACILEYKEVAENGPGILGSASQSHSMDEAYYIDMRKSYFPGSDSSIRYIKMKGRKVYEYAMKYVPAAMKDCLDKSGVSIHELKKVFIHQANEKMDEGIINRLYKLYNLEPLENVMPMSIHWLGNSSVATVPTLFDMVKREQVATHQLSPGDIILFASVGAGMNVNAVCYRY
ncbi:MAG: 3-oxoacyl-ACP synthase III family protein [Chitinophagaceae bacterium]